MSTTPFAALACCLALGIVCGRFINSDLPIYLSGLCCLGGAAAIITPSLFKDKKRRVLTAYSLRNSIWAVVLPVMFIAGIILLRHTQVDEERLPPYPYSRGVVKERVITTNGERMTVEVTDFISDMGLKSSVRHFDIMLYTDATDLGIGDDIIFKANLSPANQESFGAKYMYAKGIDYTSSTDVSKIRRLGTAPSLTAKARHWRDAIVLKIERSMLSPESKAFAAALLLGDREGLTPEIRDNFAGAGIAHVLALSGLHVGIILMLLGWITKPMNLCGLRNLRFVLMAACVALFALLTGLGAPVVRASAMALCLLMAKLLQRKYSAVNVLCMAACIIILASPRALFDVGFQLSFMSALAVISIPPVLNGQMGTSLWRYPVTLVAVPSSVFVLTWPLVAWHFHSLPLLFLPLNLVLVPLLPVYMVLIVIYVTMLMVGLDMNLLAIPIDCLNWLMTKSVNLISSISAARADLFPHWIIAVLGVVAMLTIVYYIKSLSRSSFIVALSVVVLLCISAAVLPSAMPRDKLCIPANYSSMQIIYQNFGRPNTYFMPDGGYTRLELPRGTILYADAPLDRLSPYETLTADMLVVGHNFYGTLDSLIVLCNPQLLVLSARASERLEHKTEKCAAGHGLPLHRLNDSNLEFVY